MLLWLIMVKALFHIEYVCVYLISYCRTYTFITLPSEPIHLLLYLQDLYIYYSTFRTYTFITLPSGPIHLLLYLQDLYIYYFTLWTYTLITLPSGPIHLLLYLQDLYINYSTFRTYTLITLPSDFECSICNDVKEETVIIQLKCSHCK